MNDTRKSSSHNHTYNRLTRHATERCQQRGIPQRTIDLILAHGQWRRVRGNSHSVSLTRACIDSLRFLLPKADIILMEKQIGVYVIVSDRDDAIVTTAWSLRKVRR